MVYRKMNMTSRFRLVGSILGSIARFWYALRCLMYPTKEEAKGLSFSVATMWISVVGSQRGFLGLHDNVGGALGSTASTWG
jgi:hypothetical protein